MNQVLNTTGRPLTCEQGTLFARHIVEPTVEPTAERTGEPDEPAASLLFNVLITLVTQVLNTTGRPSTCKQGAFFTRHSVEPTVEPTTERTGEPDEPTAAGLLLTVPVNLMNLLLNAIGRPWRPTHVVVALDCRRRALVADALNHIGVQRALQQKVYLSDALRLLLWKTKKAEKRRKTGG